MSQFAYRIRSAKYGIRTVVLLVLSCLFILSASAESSSQESTESDHDIVQSALPVIQLTVEPELLWNKETGMLTVGDQARLDVLPFTGTVYREFGTVPHPGHIVCLNKSGETILDSEMLICLSDLDYFAMDMPQKPFLLQCGDGNQAFTFASAFYHNREYSDHHSLLLRNGGGMDCLFTRINSAFQTMLLDDLEINIIHPASMPVVVWLNQEYWGQYYLTENTDQWFIAQQEHYPAEKASEIALIKDGGVILSGSKDDLQEYKDMIQQISQSHPAEKQEDLQYILDHVDVDSYLNYIAVEMFAGNSDIAACTCYYRLPDGKWKWLWQDGDYGFFNSQYQSPKTFLDPKGMTPVHADNTLLLKLLEVSEYRELFLNKLGQIYQKWTSAYMLDVLENCVKMIETEMRNHWSRWAPENDTNIINELSKDPDEALAYWYQRVDRLRNVIRKRPTLLWEYVQESFHLSTEEMEGFFGPKPGFPPEALF